MSRPPDRAETRSVHGGRLPVEEQAIRAEAFANLFGGSADRSAGRFAIGRFEVLRTLGAGGMGTVFAAHDADLDRTVAIKVVRSTGGADSAVLHRRMLREAKALAQLGHPHVVTVFEVGAYEDGIFIAMEYVDGPTLRGWVAEADRSQEEIVRVYVAAARGLAAAHRRGIIHRDFKPDNVLLDSEQGRPRVADFGLATPAAPGGDPVHGDAATRPHTTGGTPDSGPTDREPGGLTSEGTRVGTPAYMSPEQRRGESLSPASDQYSFCVALAEALLGKRPSGAKDVEAAVQLPHRLRRTIIRGLAPAPESRWPDFEALIAQLEPRGARRAWALGGLLAVGSGAVAVVLLGGGEPTCERPEPLSWASATEAEVGKRLLAAKPAYVGETWPLVRAELDRHAQGWVAAVNEACAAGRTRDAVRQSEAMGCLERGRVRFEAVLAGLRLDSEAWGPVAVTMVSGLPEAAACNSATPPRAETASGGGALQRERSEMALEEAIVLAQLALARARSGADADFAGVWAEAEERARSVVEWAKRVDSAGVQSEAQRLLGQVALQEGEASVAAERFAQAAAAAERSGDVRGRARSLSLQAYAVGQDRARLHEARRLAKQALAALDGVGGDPWVRAHILNSLGSIAARARPPRLEEAVAQHRRAVALFSEVVGDRHPETLQSRLSLGATLNRAGDSRAALAELDAATDAVAGVWGEHHPTYARSLRIRGLARLRAKQPLEAAEDIRRSLQIHTEAFGPEHPEVANDLYNLALALRRNSADADALAALERGLGIREQQLGPEHPELIPWLLLTGRVHVSLGHASRAVPLFERALSLCELDGALPFEFARLRLLLAEALKVEEPTRARLLATKALAFFVTETTYKKRQDRARAVVAEITDGSPRRSAEPTRSR